MEEQRARQEAEAQKAASETPGGETAESQAGGTDMFHTMHSFAHNLKITASWPLSISMCERDLAL